MAKTGFYQTNPEVETTVSSQVETSTDQSNNDDKAKTSFYQGNQTYEDIASATTVLADCEAAQAAAEAAQAAAEAAQAAAELAETNAETAETNAELAETNAETAETNAETAETNAAASASAASTSATNAATSATNAATSATNAATSATAAQTAQTAAELAETNAETAETNAETAETNAEAAQSYAEEWANNPFNTLVSAAAGGDQVDDYSALHWATVAQALTTIDALTDVTISAVGDNEILQYDSGTSQWINQTLAEAGIQPLDADLTSWASVTRASGFDTFVATPSQANFMSLITDETFVVDADIGSTVQAYDADLDTWATLTPSANAQSLVTAANYAAMRTLLDLEAGTDFYSIAAADAAFQPIDADLTSWAGVTRASGFDTFVATPSSANLASLVTGETGSGALVFGTSPTLTTSALLSSGFIFNWNSSDITLTHAADNLYLEGGALTIGHSSNLAIFFDGTNAGKFEVLGTGSDTSIGFCRWAGASSNAPRFNFAKSRGGSIGSFAVVADNDSLGDISWCGDDGDSFVQAAIIRCRVNGTPGGSDMPAEIVFMTTPDAGSSATAKWSVTAAGNLQQLTAATSISDTADAAILTFDTLANGQTIGATGFAATPYSAGTKSSGTYTPDEANGNFQYATNGGAHTLAPPTNNCNIVIQYTNNGSAGTITTSGFTKVSGDSFTTTNGHDFMCYITKLNGFSHLNVVALQ